MRPAAKRAAFLFNHQFIQEYPMATSAAVKEAPATKFAKDQLKAIIERLESIADRCSQNAELIRHMALEYLEAG